MKKEFIPYEQALELKELGFNEQCMKGYTEEYKTLISFSSTHTNTSVEKTLPTKPLTAPLYQQAFRWFREKGYRPNIICDSENINSYYFDVWNVNQFEYETDYIYNSYEEAELECLKKLIEIVRNAK